MKHSKLRCVFCCDISFAVCCPVLSDISCISIAYMKKFIIFHWEIFLVVVNQFTYCLFMCIFRCLLRPRFVQNRWEHSEHSYSLSPRWDFKCSCNNYVNFTFLIQKVVAILCFNVRISRKCFFIPSISLSWNLDHHTHDIATECYTAIFWLSYPLC